MIDRNLMHKTIQWAKKRKALFRAPIYMLALVACLVGCILIVIYGFLILLTVTTSSVKASLPGTEFVGQSWSINNTAKDCTFMVTRIRTYTTNALDSGITDRVIDEVQMAWHGAGIVTHRIGKGAVKIYNRTDFSEVSVLVTRPNPLEFSVYEGNSLSLPPAVCP